MHDEPTKDLATRAFQKRVLDEFAAVRAEQAAMRKDITEMRGDLTRVRDDIAGMRSDIAELRGHEAAMARTLASIDPRLTTLEERVDSRVKETRPIWEVVKSQIEKLDAKFDEFIHDLYDLRGDLRLHEKRLNTIEGRLPS